MQKGLEQRVAALEAKGGPPEGIRFILIVAISPTEPSREVRHAWHAEHSFARADDETEEQFLERVKAVVDELNPGRLGPALITCGWSPAGSTDA